jgi:hypothetical protein
LALGAASVTALMHALAMSMITASRWVDAVVALHDALNDVDGSVPRDRIRLLTAILSLR